MIPGPREDCKNLLQTPIVAKAQITGINAKGEIFGTYTAGSGAPAV
jgi:hypothetical protein